MAGSYSGASTPAALVTTYTPSTGAMTTVGIPTPIPTVSSSVSSVNALVSPVITFNAGVSPVPVQGGTVLQVGAGSTATQAPANSVTSPSWWKRKSKRGFSFWFLLTVPGIAILAIAAIVGFLFGGRRRRDRD